MMSKTFGWIILCVLMGSSLWAEQVTVTQVTVRAEDTLEVDPTSAVLAQCSVKAGLTDDAMHIQMAITNDVKELLAMPDYARVDAFLDQDDPKQWKVMYIVERRALLAAAPAITGLNGAVRERKAIDVLKMPSNAPVDDTLAAAAAARLRDELVDNGYTEAKVTYDLEETEVPGYATLTFKVEPGVERDIRDYVFEGNTVYDHDTLAGQFGWRPFWNPVGWFADDLFSTGKMDDARAVVNNYYIDRGYLDAVVEFPEVRPIAGKDEGVCDLVFKVTEGPLYTIGDITVEGATLYPAENIRGAAQQVLRERGNVATSETLSAIQEAMEDYYGSRGYVDTYANVRRRGRADGAAVIDLHVTMSEGELATIGRIEIRGNTITKDKVLRREVVIQPGEAYDARLVRRSVARLQNLNYFLPKAEGGVTSYTVKTETPGVRDLVFNVRERETGKFGFGLGFSSVDSVFVFASAEQNNFDLWNPSNGFRGGGQRARVGVEYGSRRQTAELSWTEPWLFDMPLSFTFDAYRKMRWYDHYDQINTGAAFTFAWKPAPFNTPFGEVQLDRLGVRYTIETIEYDDAETAVYWRPDGRPFSFATEDDGLNSKLRFFWSENHRNQPFFTTGGWESNVYLEVGFLGEAKDYGFGFNIAKWWNPWKDHTLMTRFRFDTVEAYSGDVPMFDR